MTGKQLCSVLLSASSAPVKSSENSPCNFISEAQCILPFQRSDRNFSSGVRSEMRVGLDWVCLSFFQMTPLVTVQCSTGTSHCFCSEANDTYFTDLAFTFDVIQILLSSTRSSVSFHFIPHDWEFHFVFQVYLYVLLKIHIYMDFVMSLAQMNVNAQMEFTRSSSLNF